MTQTITTDATTTAPLARIQPYASSAQVREWAAANDLPTGFGRVPTETVKAYNKSHAVKYVPGKHVETVVVEGRKNGKKVTRKANVKMVRDALASQGVDVGSRGRIAYALVAQALGLEPIEQPKADGTVVFRGQVVPAAEARATLIAEGKNVGSRGALPAALLV